MKKRIFNVVLCVVLLGLSIVSMTACSQTVCVEKERIIYDASNQIKEKSVFTYDAKGNMTQEDEYKMIDNTLTLQYVYKYAYNDNNDEILYECYRVDQNDPSIKTLSVKTTKEYDEKLLKVETKYDGDVVEYKIEYTYDEKGRQIEELKSNYDANTQEFTKFSIVEDVYNTDFNNPSLSTGYRFTNGVKNAEPMMTTKYVLDNRGNSIYSEYEMDLGIIKMKDASCFIYNENNKQTSYLSYSINTETGEYVLDSVYDYNYIDGKHRSEAIYQSFRNGILTDVTRSTHEYDKDYNIIKSSTCNYNFDTEEFELKEYTVYSYTTIKK